MALHRWLLRLAFALFATGFVALIVVADRGGAARMWEFAGKIPCGDKLGHLVGVGAFSVLLNLQLERRPAFARGMMLGSLLLLTGMTLEECSQAFLPSRTFDGVDWLANLAGVLCGEGLVRMLPGRQPGATVPAG